MYSDGSNLITEELIGLERDNNGRIDHGPSGINSKDSADAFCGSLFSASKHAEEYAFDFGEDLETIVEHNTDVNEDQRNQIVVDFEEELNKIFDPIQRQQNNQDKQKKEQNQFLDFGFGSSTELYSMYTAQGILI